MADVSSAASDTVYRPVAGLAIAGFAISCLFGGVVAVSAILALWQGAPFFFPVWSVLIAAAGALVSWWAQNDIRNSEGAKAGHTLARWGLWISLVTGAGYLAYSYFTGLALSQQAMDFFMKDGDEPGFFAMLKKGAKDKTELYRAFLLTLPAPAREGVRVDDEASLRRQFDKPAMEGSLGDLSRFLKSPFVEMISILGDRSDVEPIGVRTWKYEKRSYYVLCQFRLKTPEASAAFLLAARSSEGEAEGQRREWFVDIHSYSTDLWDKTDLGKGLAKARGQAMVYFNRLEAALREGKGLPQTVIDAANWTKFDAVTRDAAQRQDCKSRVDAVLRGAIHDYSWQFNVPEPTVTDWQRDDEGRLSIPFSVTTLFLSQDKKVETFGVDGAFTVRSKAAIDPYTYAESGSLVQPEWDVTRLEFTLRRTKPPNK